MDGKWISYLRVSTDRQGKSGLGIEAQRNSVAEYLNAQIDGVVSGDMELRRGVDPIHDTRVAIRRMRR